MRRSVSRGEGPRPARRFAGAFLTRDTRARITSNLRATLGSSVKPCPHLGTIPFQMDRPLSRRRFLFLGLPLLSLVRPGLCVADATQRVARTYHVDIGILFNVVTLGLKGTIAEDIDRAAGRYRVVLTGQGAGVSTRTEGAGIIRDGRFKPTEVQSTHTVRGRENRTTLAYDYERGLIEYHSVSYTFFLGRRRQADDVLRLAPGQQVDDLFSAELNFAENKLDVEPDGAYRATVVRRARPADEGPDDAAAAVYRAELVTLRFHAAPEPGSGRLTARIDLTGFSSWARSNKPARVAFGADRHLESIESSLILGTTFTVRFDGAS